MQGGRGDVDLGPRHPMPYALNTAQHPQANLGISPTTARPPLHLCSTFSRPHLDLLLLDPCSTFSRPVLDSPSISDLWLLDHCSTWPTLSRLGLDLTSLALLVPRPFLDLCFTSSQPPCSTFSRPLLDLLSTSARPLLIRPVDVSSTPRPHVQHSTFHPCSTPARPLLDPSSTPARPLLDPCSTPARPLLDPCSTPPRPPQLCSRKKAQACEGAACAKALGECPRLDTDAHPVVGPHVYGVEGGGG